MMGETHDAIRNTHDENKLQDSVDHERGLKKYIHRNG